MKEEHKGTIRKNKRGEKTEDGWREGLGGGGIQRNTKEDKQQQTLRSLLGCLRLLTNYQ